MMHTTRKWQSGIGRVAGIIVLAGVLLLGAGLGWWLGGREENAAADTALGPVDAEETLAAANEPAAAEPEILYWVAPMDANYRRDKPGKSPMGMDLVPVYAKPASQREPGGITITPAVEHNLGIRTQAAEIRPLWRRIEATGYVSLDENRLRHVHVRTSGWIENLRVSAEGERLEKGQVLFDFYAPELVNAQKEFLQAERRDEQRLAAAAQEKLRALGMQQAEIEALGARGEPRQTIAVVAHSSGVVTALNVREGMFIKPDSEVMTLADLSTVWLQAEIFEDQADWVKAGQAAEARLDYLPGEVFAGVVDYVYPVLDARTRTLRVRLRFDNPEERLKPNMYARVSVFGNTHLDALSIPRDALIRAPSNSRVVVAEGDGNYRVHEVMTGIESGDWVEIVAGLEAGDRVVTSAQFLLDSESSLSGFTRRLESAVANSPQGNTRPRTVFGSGVVEQLDRTSRRMTISHGPIDTLGWPSMTMEFEVLETIDLARVRTGQNVHFSIRPDETGVYVIDMIHLVDSATSVEEASGKGPDQSDGMDHSGHHSGAHATSPERHSGENDRD